MRSHFTKLCIAAVLVVGCQKAEDQDADSAELEEMTKQHEAWAARQPRPPIEVVERIERLLAKEPCVGSLDQWLRVYAYQYDRQAKALYPGIVDFHLEEAGKFGVRAGRRLTEPKSWINVDDRPMKMAGGDYDIKEDRVRFSHCGQNVGVTTTDVEQLRAYWNDLDERFSHQNSMPER